MNENKLFNGAEESPEESKLDLSSLGRFADKLNIGFASESGDEASSGVKLDEDFLVLGGLASEENATVDSEPCDAESIHKSATAMIESGSGSLNHAIEYLKKSAEEGYSDSWIYLGRLYGNGKSGISCSDMAGCRYEKLLYGEKAN